jgi:Flp pilus assembly protein TadG
MKTSRHFAPTLLLLAVAAAFGLGVVSQVGAVVADSAADAAQAVAVQANSLRGDHERRCEQRDVAADEGYGVSRMERRMVCE